MYKTCTMELLDSWFNKVLLPIWQKQQGTVMCAPCTQRWRRAHVWDPCAQSSAYLASSRSVRDPVSNWGRRPLMVVLWTWSACAPSHMYTHRRTNMHTQSRVEFCGPTDVQHAHTILCWVWKLEHFTHKHHRFKWKGRGHIETALLTMFIRLFFCAILLEQIRARKNNDDRSQGSEEPSRGELQPGLKEQSCRKCFANSSEK